MLGNVLANADHDWAAALTEVEKALALNPGSAAAQQNYAFSQIQRGHYDPGIAAARRASELDPLSLNVLLNLANTLHFARHGEEAETVYRRVLAAEPDRPRVNAFLALVIYLRGAPEPARAIAARESLRYSRLTALAIIDRALGRREAAAASLKELSDTYGDKAATQYAQIYAQWGQPDQAFEWLDRGLTMRDPGLLLAKVDPMLEPLHPDPRWRLFLNNLGLGDSSD